MQLYKNKFKLSFLLGVLFIFSINGIANADELKEQIGFNELKYGKGYFVTTTIPVTISEKVKFTPDILTFSVKLLTEADDAKTAFNNNTEAMTEFRRFLVNSGIIDKDLKTLSYRNFENLKNKVIETDEKDRCQSRLTVVIHIETKDFFNVYELLENYHIDVSQLQKSSSNYYMFSINAINTSADLAKSTVKERFNVIKQKLQEMNINNIEITNYENEVIRAQNRVEKVKNYFVENQLQIKLRDFKQIGAILAKIQELKMTFNNDMVYSLSDEEREKIIQQHESIMLKKMLSKAELYLGNNQHGYTLGNLISITPDLNAPTTAVLKKPPINQRDNISQEAMFYKSSSIDVSQIIQAPSEYEVTLLMSGVFEVLAKYNEYK